MSSPLVSVIVPVYNAEKYLEKCLESLRSQTLRDIEIICINDGSTDSSSDILLDYRARDRRIKLIQTENLGQSKARNFGLLHAGGKYLGFVDSDDFVEPDMFEKMAGLAESSDADCVACGLRVEFEDPDDYNRGAVSWGKAKREGSLCVCNEALRNLRTNVLDKLFRRSIISQNNILFPSNINLNEDGVFVWSVLPHCKVISFIKEELYHYIQRENSTMHKIYSGDSSRLLELPVSWRILVDRLTEQGLLTKIYRSLLDVIIGNVVNFSPYVSEDLKPKWEKDIQDFFRYLHMRHPNILRRYIHYNPQAKRLILFFLKNETTPYTLFEKFVLTKYKILSHITSGSRKKHYREKYSRLKSENLSYAGR